MERNQTSFFDTDQEVLELPDADVTLYRHYFDLSTSKKYFKSLKEEILWREEEIILYGKVHNLPRLSAWYGDPASTYTYSGIFLNPNPWTPVLNELRKIVNRIAGSNFNSLLANLYRDQNDSVSWHADDEPELGENPTIASISLGETRRFVFKKKTDPTTKFSLELGSGDILVMKGATQKNWMHQVPKSSKILQPRVNLTFRTILLDSKKS